MCLPSLSSRRATGVSLEYVLPVDASFSLAEGYICSSDMDSTT